MRANRMPMRALTQDRIICADGLPALVAAPVDADGLPCVILLHERYGLVRHTEELAARLAREGYVVAAPDLFHDAPDLASLHKGESKVASDDPRATAQIASVRAYLARDPRADTERLAIVGVCQTGRIPLVIDASAPIRACLVLYGAAQDREWERHERFPTPLGELLALGRAPVLGLFGERDHAISLAHVERFRDALERTGRSYDIAFIHGAPHGWLNDTMPGRYRPEQAAAAWAKITAFLEEHLVPRVPRSGVHRRYTAAYAADYDFTQNVRME